MKRYILVGGEYVGGGSYVGLWIVGSANTYEECVTETDKHYDRCGGLLLWIDTTTGKAGEPEGPRSLKF